MLFLQVFDHGIGAFLIKPASFLRNIPLVYHKTPFIPYPSLWLHLINSILFGELALRSFYTFKSGYGFPIHTGKYDIMNLQDINMLKRHSFTIRLASLLVLVSVVLYSFHYLIFRDLHHIFIYLVGELAFLPIEVLVVVLIIERVLSQREQNEKLQKLNMVIGAFFSQVGNPLLCNLLQNFKNKEEISSHLNLKSTWTKSDFKEADEFADHLKIDIDSSSLDLAQLKSYLSERRSFLLTLLGNPVLLEHDRFTDLLWAVTHLDEELEARDSLDDLPRKDLEHIETDIQRMYDHLASEWLDYVQHLKLNYPYLFSLVLRTHPFQPHPSPTVS
jgi:hypothetical protein